jgi:hypothetical protein
MSRRWAQVLVLLALVAVGLLAIRERDHASDQRAWEELASARSSVSPVQALEASRELAVGTSAESFAAFYLALELAAGSSNDFARASEVARAAATASPDHPLSSMLSRISACLEEYRIEPREQ